MPPVRIPLVGSFTQRGLDGQVALAANQDQRFKNCTFSVIQNPVTGKAAVYVAKRHGFVADSVVSAGAVSTGFLRPQAFVATLSSFGATNSTIYFGTTSVGTITGRAIHFTETLISSVAHVMIRSSDGTGWYYVNGAKDITAYTCDGNNSTTLTDFKVAGAPSVSGLYIGQKLTAATNIPAGSRIVSINSGTFEVVIDTTTTGGAFNDLATTKEPIAKIIDADFVTTGTFISAFVEMDGFLFYATDDGNVRNSDINNVTAYTSTSFLAAQMSPDLLVGLARHKNMIVAFGSASKEVFYNAGNASGSPLNRSTQFFDKMGALDQRSIAVIENDIYYVSTPHYGDVGVYVIRDMESKRISTPTVDKIMGTIAASGGAIYASAFRMGGYKYASFFMSSAADVVANSNILLETGDAILLESGGTDNLLLEEAPAVSTSYVSTMVYNADLNLWSEWDCDKATYIDGIGSGTTNQILATSRVDTGGKVFTVNPVSGPSVFTDDTSVTVTAEIRTGKLDFGSANATIVKSITLICDQESAGTVVLEANDDDYAPSSWVTIGSFDLTARRTTLYPAGHGLHQAGRAYRLTHGSANAFRAEALEFDVIKGLQ